ncbi:MAG TPA: hypothetical protein VGG69_08800 [Rhizomicrobium sp.]
MIEAAVHVVIGWFVLPLWIGAGFADYLFHRRTHIERTAGVKESLLHHLMMAEVALPLFAATFLRINAAIVLLFAACFIAHEITTNVDIRYAENHGRDVSPTEDQVHSILEIIPLTAGLLVLLPHFGQVRALFGIGSEQADFSLALKQPPPLWQILITAAAALLFNIIPYTEETVRTLRARRRLAPDLAE